MSDISTKTNSAIPFANLPPPHSTRSGVSAIYPFESRAWTDSEISCQGSGRQRSEDDGVHLPRKLEQGPYKLVKRQVRRAQADGMIDASLPRQRY